MPEPQIIQERDCEWIRTPEGTFCAISRPHQQTYVAIYPGSDLEQRQMPYPYALSFLNGEVVVQLPGKTRDDVKIIPATKLRALVDAADALNS